MKEITGEQMDATLTNQSRTSCDTTSTADRPTSESTRRDENPDKVESESRQLVVRSPCETFVDNNSNPVSPGNSEIQDGNIQQQTSK